MQERRLAFDFVVVGCGIAGLRAAIELAHAGEVLILAKSELTETATDWAHAGIAAALSDEDEIGLHEHDTICSGDGLCDPAAVKALVEEGPHHIQELIAWGTQFDRSGTKLSFAREGSHSRSRVLHAHGESTGREISRALFARAHSLGRIHLRPHAFTTDLAVEDGRVAGVRFLDESSKQLQVVRSRASLFATGGLGQIYHETTNPPVATGDGVAIAYSAGAVLRDMEFVQFHPTVLCVKGAPPFLLSEALRGEGAVLRNVDLERFMSRYHEAGELAPRDVLARAIVTEIQRTRTNYVYLDLTGLNAESVRKHFPRINSACLKYGLDITTDLVPIRPAAHYAIGGIKTDLDGRSSLPGLYAAGEAACNGVHGANRLASNALLEGLVFGARAGKAMVAEAASKKQAASTRHNSANNPDHNKSGAAEAATAGNNSFNTAAADPVLEKIRSLMWKHVGILRTGRELAHVLQELETLRVEKPQEPSRQDWERHHLWTLGQIIARCALAREESRGCHYRSEFPFHQDERFSKHSTIELDGKARFE